jgi:hypothetical protein
LRCAVVLFLYRYFSEADILHTGHPPSPIFVGVKMYQVREIYLPEMLHILTECEYYWSAEEVQAMHNASRNFGMNIMSELFIYAYYI